MIISIVHSNSHITERITNILDYHLHHPYTISNTLIPADLCFTDTLEDIPRIRNINKKAFIVIVTNHPLGPETVIYQPFYYIFEDSLEKDIPFIDYSLVIAPVVADLCTTPVALSAPPNSYQNNSQS